MSTIQHIDLPSNQIHEAKQIVDATTGDAGKVITPSSATSGEGVLRNLTLDEIDSTGSGSLFSYWAYYEDDEFRVGSKRAISGGVRTLITVDGLAPATSEAGLVGLSPAWDTDQNKVLPINENDVLLVRLSFEVDTQANDASLLVEADIGGSIGPIFGESKPVLKGAGERNRYVMSWPMYIDAVALSNGISLFVTPSHDINLWNAAVFIHRSHKGA